MTKVVWKFKINENKMYCGYGTDGTIEFDSTFNINNPPVNHKYYRKKWVLVEDKVKESRIKEIYEELDDISTKMVHNNTRYIDHPEYKAFDDKYRNKVKELEEELESLK